MLADSDLRPLATAAATGDSDALEALLAMLQPMIAAYTRKIPDLWRDDVKLECQIAIWQVLLPRVATIPNIASYAAYLFKLRTKRWFSFNRRRRRDYRKTVDLDEAVQHASPIQSPAEQIETDEQLNQLIGQILENATPSLHG